MSLNQLIYTGRSILVDLPPNLELRKYPQQRRGSVFQDYTLKIVFLSHRPTETKICKTSLLKDSWAYNIMYRPTIVLEHVQTEKKLAKQ